MSGKVWMSSLISNYEIGNKQGVRTKFYNHDWNPAEFNIPVSPGQVSAAINRYARGFSLERRDFPETASVWREDSFRKVRDIFAVGGFYCVKGELAEVFARFDLGEGGLIPFPIYKSDLETPYPGEFFLLNFGCRKNTLLPEESGKISKFVVEQKTGIQFWKVDDWIKEPVVLGASALEGPDLWFEEILYSKLFLSDALAQSITDIGMRDVFDLEECRVVGDVQ